MHWASRSTVEEPSSGGGDGSPAGTGRGADVGSGAGAVNVFEEESVFKVVVQLVNHAWG